MSKFCPMCGQVTNCTDNCNSCMSEEKRYTLYAWRTDDEGGYGVCRRDEFSYKVGYHPESGPWAMPSQRVGDFDTLEELTNLILAEEPGYSREFAIEDAKLLMDGLNARMKGDD